MIDTIAKRRVTFNGTTYQKGDTVPMLAAHLAEFEGTGLFERAPAKKVAPSKSSDTAD